MTDRDTLQLNGKIVAEKYRIERLVGEGGFAVVYRALHTIWNKPVAIKFFNGLSSAPAEQRDEFQKAFIQEGALLTELSSQTAAIVQARDVGTYTTPDGQWMPYMVLEWLEGAALDEILEREIRAGNPPFTTGEVHALLDPVAHALDVAHGKGIAHRDIKPPNLFVLGNDPRGGKAAVSLALYARSVGREVTLVSEQPVLAPELGLPGRFRLIHDTDASGVTLHVADGTDPGDLAADTILRIGRDSLKSRFV
jgi:serine/threonine protein kinase